MWWGRTCTWHHAKKGIHIYRDLCDITKGWLSVTVLSEKWVKQERANLNVSKENIAINTLFCIIWRLWLDDRGIKQKERQSLQMNRIKSTCLCCTRPPVKSRKVPSLAKPLNKTKVLTAGQTKKAADEQTADSRDEESLYSSQLKNFRVEPPESAVSILWSLC